MNYIEAISIGFPNVQCHALGDGTDYNSIVWEAGAPLPSQATLDEWIAANNVTPSRHITVLAFRNRFTTAEKIAIDLASLDNPTASSEQRQFSAMVRVFIKDLDVATFVDLDRNDTVVGVNTLETYGVIGSGRANTILTAPVTPIEIPMLSDFQN